MGEFEYELVDDAVDSNGPAGELELRVRGIVEDEIVLVKVSEFCAPNAASHLILGQSYKKSPIYQALWID